MILYYVFFLSEIIQEQNLETFISVGEDLGLTIGILDKKNYPKKPFRQTVGSRYRCPECRNWWRSDQSTISIWIYRDNSDSDIDFHVNLEYYGQQCSKCDSTEYYMGIFDDDDRLKEIWEKLLNPKRGRREHVVEPSRGPHKSHLCEACALGVCSGK